MSEMQEISYHSRVRERARVYEDNYKPLSSPEAIELFMKSSVWSDMLDLLDSWREASRSKLEGVSDTLELGRLQGEANAYSKLIRLPEAMLEYIEGERKEQTDGKAGRQFTRTRV